MLQYQKGALGKNFRDNGGGLVRVRIEEIARDDAACAMKRYEGRKAGRKVSRTSMGDGNGSKKGV